MTIPGDGHQHADDVPDGPHHRSAAVHRSKVKVVSTAPRVVIADGNALARAGLEQLLTESGVAVVGQAMTTAEVLKVVHASHPDVVLVDLHLPERSGIHATRELQQAAPGA